MNKIIEIQGKMTALLERDAINFIEKDVNFFDAPLIGVADAKDQLFSRYKNEEQIIGSIFRQPAEWVPDAKSVISYFLPFSSELRRSNYFQGPAASVWWLHGRFRGEKINDKLRKLVVDELIKIGGKAVAPLLWHDDPSLRHKNYYVSLETQSSNWSERHAAYAARLGTFSHQRSLISEKGCAGRYGSVITDLWFEPTKRSREDLDEYCLSKRGEMCGKCIERCPSGAITPEGKDKQVCYDHFIAKDPCATLKNEKERLGYGYSMCGKCQLMVPCESRIPG